MQRLNEFFKLYQVTKLCDLKLRKSLSQDINPRQLHFYIHRFDVGRWN